LSMYLSDIFVSASALAGVPGLSIPVDKTKTGLPVGLQILGPRLFEGKVLQFGSAIEKNL